MAHPAISLEHFEKKFIENSAKFERAKSSLGSPNSTFHELQCYAMEILGDER